MALGFGFNKAKVLASAEKYVQQGKLQNAISEYGKIIAKDSRDLTVLNTIGDLYARLGQSERAGEYFRRVGDAYAGDGFTVKAIAMYKKLAKLSPGNLAVVQRLADLYTQQGLYNDARHQYLQLADAAIKSSDFDGAIKVFQKMLEIDPDNVSLQSKLADVYLKTGRKQEARDIFFKAAQGLYERGSVEQAEQSLGRTLALDPANVEALLMRAKIAADAGNAKSAAAFYEKVPDLDSRADALQSLMRAYVVTGNGEAAEGIARKLATVHNDLSGIRVYADFLLAGGNGEAVLSFYDEWIDRLIVGDSGEIALTLQALAGQVKESPASLERLRSIFQKAGASANIPEVTELLAHAYVQSGELAKARDLYKELADLEPSNPQHMLNYRQVLARMGEEPTARPLPPSEAAQALFVEEIEAPLPPAQQQYPASLQEKINTVLADAELFESYNKPQQALHPLEGVLAKAPRDVRINQRLISVYSRLGKPADAARCCDTLRDVYQQAKMATEAQKYSEMASRFRQRAGIATPAEPVMPVLAEEPAPLPVAKVEAPGAPLTTSEAPAVPMEFGEAHEIDLSSEWEAAIAEPAEMPAMTPVKEASTPSPSDTGDLHPSLVADLLEEIRFYIEQRMLDEARAAIARCEKAVPASFELRELKQQIAAIESGPPLAEAEEVSAVEAEIESPSAVDEAVDGEEGTVVEFDFAAATAEAVKSAAIESVPTFEVTAADPGVEEIEIAETAEQSDEALPEPAEPGMPVGAPATEEVPETAAEETPVLGTEPITLPAWARAPEAEYVETANDEARERGEAVEPAAVKVLREEVPTPGPAAETVVAEVEAVAAEDLLADFVLELEDSLPADFGRPEQPITIQAMAAAASAGSPAPGTVPAIAAAPSTVPDAAPAETPVVGSRELPLSAEEKSSVLSDLFAEFKEEVGEPQEEEDPETHYNLGVAFKEMGLLDEAIGELQKVCKFIDRGRPFSQVMQAYTWLAGCFVEKGVPEASIKWYNKALTVAADDESRTALHYDLASAYEASGDRQQALKHFMEVYGTNIDYRDVAQRIKGLKS
jgi:tetratricopeptide (TPR) repeat protein